MKIGSWVIIAVLLAILVATISPGYEGWTMGWDYIAMALGLFFSMVIDLACRLLRLPQDQQQSRTTNHRHSRCDRRHRIRSSQSEAQKSAAPLALIDWLARQHWLTCRR
jgi:hypothetical protein